ncbi:MAG: VC0807 family protein [Thiobacillus sp.]|nr:MAG: MFS transporter [Thiobacillus sp. SCN 63-374]OZA26806.1 MAG: MFS transporter [Hydrogenophilales bacterium 17-64-11]
MPPSPTPTRSPLLEIGVTLLIPSLILIQLSKPEQLGAAGALVLALAFPIGWGLRELAKSRGFGLFAGLGVASLLLTGGIGLLELDARWLAVKEAAIPAVLGLVVAGSAFTRRPLVRVLLYTPMLLDTERIDAALAERGNQAAFAVRLRAATWMLAGSFAFSAAMNYALATWIVTSPAGSAAFNEELGRLTLLSYPMIALPATLMMLAVLYYLAGGVRRLAGLGLGDMLRGK